MTKFTFLMAWEHILKDNYEPDIFLSLTLNEHNVLLAEVSPAYSLQLTIFQNILHEQHCKLVKIEKWKRGGKKGKKENEKKFYRGFVG